MLDVGIRESTATTGTGSLTLVEEAGFVRISEAFTAGDLVSYLITSGNDREWGIGTLEGGGTFARTFVSASLVSGTFSRANTPITLAGTSYIVCTAHPGGMYGGISGFISHGLTARYVPHAVNGTALTTLGMTANRGYFMPFIPVHCPKEFGSLGIEVTTLTAGTAYVALFETSIASGNYRPGRRLYQTGALDTGTTGEKLTGSLAIRLRPGTLYWIAVTASSTCTMRAVGVGGINALLGFSNATTTSRSHIYATQSGAFGTDASGLTYTIATGNAPAPLLAP
jgi:hypothetical protein